MTEHSIMLFSGTSHRDLAEQIAKDLDISLGKAEINKFPDGEIGVRVLENVRGRDVFVVQSIARNPSFYLMQLLILIDALKRASAHSIVAVIPYFGYARQDRRDKGREPITAKLVANMLEKAGATRVLTMDLHAPQIEGFFDIPVDNLHARPLLLEALRKKGVKPEVIVAPDEGSIKLSRDFANDIGVEFAIVDKRRITPEKVSAEAIIGNVKDKTVLLIDDMCSTGGTLKAASLACKSAGAKQVYAAVTHGLLLSPAFEESAIEKLLTGNTIPLPEGFKSDKVEMISVSALFAKAIRAIQSGHSISCLNHASE